MGDRGEGSMRDDELVTIYATDMQGRVAVIKMALDEAEIPYMAVGDVVSSIYPIVGMALVRFQVFHRDADRAQEVLTALGLAE